MRLRLLLAGLLGSGSLAVLPLSPAIAAPVADLPPRPASTQVSNAPKTALKLKERPPAQAPKPESQAPNAKRLAAPCEIGDFTGQTGPALVAAIKAADIDCISTLFSLTGTNARGAFREAQMITVTQALRDNGAAYPGDNSTRTGQLVYYLRAGYYVQYYHPDDVGSYGSSLKSAIQSALDAFFANSRAYTVSEGNGSVLGEAVILIDSSTENARYLYVVRRLLNSYTTAYGWNMRNAVNSTYTVLWRGHWVPEFVTAVQNDTSTLTVMRDFAIRHIGLLGTENGFLTSNAGREMGRFLQHSQLQATVRPMARDLLSRSQITGRTAPLWVGVAEMTDAYDKANCSYYDTCDLANRLKAAALPQSHTCSSALKIRAQELTASQVSSTCTSLASQDAYFHGKVNDRGPVANDNNTSLEVNVFNSSDDYGTYAGAIFGIDTNNGGMYLEGNPSAPGNQARFIAYERTDVSPGWQIWNLNHEYTHYLDGRYNMYGDFTANISTPTIWWIEGAAEYIAYGYRRLDYTSAINEAGKHTYSLSTLFDTTYDHGTTRVYQWGYLAVRYMFEKRRSELDTVLGHYRTGNWNAARSFVKGLNLNAEFDTWLTACANGACSGDGGTNQRPVANFTSTVNGLTASFTDTSTDPDGTIASRNWNFGDGTASTAANPAKTYSTAGTYTVRLDVTDDKGATASISKQVTVGGPGVPECSDPDTRALGKDCKRSGISGTTGGYTYMYIYLPAGTVNLTIASSGGSGNADLYYNPATWATTSGYTQRSAGAGNAHTLSVTNTAEGYRYISLYGVAAFSGVTVTTSY